jgi:polysaccharide biosynthesis transport protein
MDRPNHFYEQSPTALDKSLVMSYPPTSYHAFNGSNDIGVGEDSESDGGLVEYWRIFRRHKWTILLSTIGALILGFLAGIPMKPMYRAHASVEVLNINQDFMNMKQTSPVNSDSSFDDTSEEQTQAKLMQSESVLKRVFAQLSGESSRVGAAGPRIESPRSELIAQAAASLVVHPFAKTRLIDISVSSTNPKLAADFANTLTQEFIQQNLEGHFQATRTTGDWLSRELNDARKELIRSENALQAYARESGLIFTDEDTNVATGKLQQFQDQLSAAIGDRITKQSRLALAQNSPPDSLTDILSDVGLHDIVSKLNASRTELADLSTIYTPDYDKTKRAQAQVDNLQAAFERTRTDILRRIQNDYDEATQKEKMLSAAYDRQVREVTGQGAKTIQYNILKRDVDSNRLLYDTMLQQLKQSAIASALRASNLRIVDSAAIPTKPFFPNFKLNSAVGMVTGLFLSMALVLLHERADRTLQQPGDVKLRVGLPELGTIPRANIASKKRSDAKFSDSESGGLSRSPRELPPPHKRNSVELVTFEEKPSMVAEAFRSTLTSILFQGENGSRPHVLVFTSAQAAEGKTTIVSNLAIAVAEIGLRVLIIDADLRRPRMHQVFDVSNDTGLSQLLRHELTQVELASLITATRIPNLNVLTAGPAAHAGANLLHSPNMIELLSYCKKRYDMILIDTPPTLQMTDARVLGRVSDAVVLVARANKTTRDALVAVSKRFSEDRIRIIGAILNDWDPKKSSNGYYGYHTSYHPYNGYANNGNG